MKGGGIAVEGLSVRYGAVAALSDLSARFGPGVHAILGPNGAGKSTLLKAIAGLVRPQSGRVLLPGRPADCVAYMAQRADIDRKVPIAAADFLLGGLWRRIGGWRSASKADLALVGAALERLGLGGLAGRMIEALSIGQFQRLLFARLMLEDRPIILLDEPFAGVDRDTTSALVAILDGWRAEGRVVLVALHEIEQLRSHFTDSLTLEGRGDCHGLHEGRDR